jgi:octaprenyl-diphosphate synthase
MNNILKEIENYKNISKKLEKFFLKELKKYPSSVSFASVYLSSAGGKRLRPLILLLVSEALNYRKADRFHMAAVIEIIHMASLIHDDVIDEAQLRRGKETLNKKLGNHFSILIGDFLYAKAISKTLEIKNIKLMNLLSMATIKMIEGEIWAQKNLRNPDLKISDYINLIKNKTGYLFASSSSIPSILSKKEKYFRELFQFGLNFGIFFQILDDTLDFVAKEEETGKPVLHDLEEGKINLPVILLNDYIDDKEKLKYWIKNSNEYKKEIKNEVEKYKTHKSALKIALNYSNKSIRYLKNIPDGKAKELLISIPEKLLSLKAFQNLW